MSFLCRKLASWYIEHLRCYEVCETTDVEILEVDDLNDKHPLTCYVIQGKTVVSLKKFLLH